MYILHEANVKHGLEQQRISLDQRWSRFILLTKLKLKRINLIFKMIMFMNKNYNTYCSSYRFPFRFNNKLPRSTNMYLSAKIKILHLYNYISEKIIHDSRINKGFH